MNRLQIGTAVVCLTAGAVSCFGKDAQAIAALTRAAQALVTGGPVASVVVSGSAAYSAGSDEETVQISFTASGLHDSQMVLERSAGAITEVRHQGVGSWSGLDNVVHPFARHNTWTSTSWFFPALLVNSWIADPELTVTDLGQEQRNGIAVEHLRCFRTPAGRMDAGTAALIAAASQMELFLDSTSALPVGFEYNTHPDANEGIDIPVRIEFGGYQSIASGTAPFHIQQFLQGTLLLDITASNIAPSASVATQIPTQQ
jgi:hypothetical protein